MIIKSNYRDSEKDQFKMEVVGETETEYLVQLLPQYQPLFQEGNEITKLRKSLVGDSENLYSFVKKEIVEQLTLF